MMRQTFSRRGLLAAGATAALLCGASEAVRAAGEAPSNDHVELTRRRVLQQSRIPVYGYRVATAHPHSQTSYTEGLLMVDGLMIEGTGLYGQSRLMQWDLASGRVVNDLALDPLYFGEGVTVLDGVIHQLTYIENKRFTYDARSFTRTGTFQYEMQGWGMTHDGRSIITSNGSSAINFRDPGSFAMQHTIFASDDLGPVGFLNELEWHDGKLYANVWQTPFIAEIDPQSGRITGWINLTGLNPDPATLVYPLVLNGIAVNAASGRLLVTGKCWPHVYEIELVKA